MTVAELSVRQRRGTVALAGREVRRVVSLWTQTILPPVVTAGLFLVVFGSALGARIREIEGLAYLDFILPGLLVMTVGSQSIANASTSLFQAKNEGYIEDVLIAPLRRLATRHRLHRRRGRTRALRRLDHRPRRGAVCQRRRTRGRRDPRARPYDARFRRARHDRRRLGRHVDQHSFVAAIAVTPLALLGGVFYSARTLAEPWSTLTRIDPIYYLVDATRYGFTGFHESSVTVSLGVAALVAAASFALAAGLVARGWRLKP